MGGVALAVGGSRSVVMTVGCLRGVILLWAVDKEACLYCGWYFGWCFVSCGWLNCCDGDNWLLEGGKSSVLILRVLKVERLYCAWLERRVNIVSGFSGVLILRMVRVAC